MAWLVLTAAGLLEVGWTVCLKYARGFTAPWPTVGFGASLIASMCLLAAALESIPLGTAYAAWTGISVVGAAVLDVVFFGEPMDVRRSICVGLILAGVVGLKLASPR